MATILPVDEIIEIGDASTYLSANYVGKQTLFGGTVIKPTPPVQIAWVTDGLRWGYEGGAQTAASLRSTANYLYWLCGLFQLQAQNIISGDGGGSVTPTPSGGTLPFPLDFIVAASGTPIVDGETSVTISQFVGYNIDLYIDNFVLYTTDPGDGSTYYSWNRTTGELVIIDGVPYTGQRIRIQPSR